jgi:pimeloyl-ACP methyl ester carboxylesterase
MKGADNMEKLYCISGLGADQRIFASLHIPGFEKVPVHWTPYEPNDALPDYARKLTAQITTPNPVIVGLSFGGMLGVEIAKIIPVRKVFIVSSARTSREVRVHGGGMSRWLINFIPPSLLRLPRPFIFNYLGAETPEDKKLLSTIIRDSDGRFMKWALKAIFNWNNSECPPTVIQLHGTADKTIPPFPIKPDYWIEGGSHIMIHNRAAEVSKIISDCLAH